MEAIDLISVSVIAFLGSFGHCIGMCGGIVIAYSSSGLKSEKDKSTQVLDHVLYSLGRVTTYTTLGAIFGALGGVVVFERITNGILWVITGIAMILVGLALAGHIRLLPAAEAGFTSSHWYQSKFRTLIRSDKRFGHYLLGLLNGLLPCGFVYVFAITAASTASPLYGALVMLIFGVSTIPSLFSLGYFIGLFKQVKLRRLMTQLGAISVIGYGLYMLYNGVGFITEPSSTILDCH
jgi:sulfite exporter TauE/SafE